MYQQKKILLCTIKFNNITLHVKYYASVAKPSRKTSNFDKDNGGAEPNEMGVGISYHQPLLFRTVVHIGI